MIIDELTVSDFRVFQGRHSFDLSPAKWNAMADCVVWRTQWGWEDHDTDSDTAYLYGRQSLGSAISAKHYDEFLRSCIHQSRDQLLQARSASVELVFRYTNMGAAIHIRLIGRGPLTSVRLMRP